MAKRRARMDKEPAKNAGFDITVGDMRSMSRGKEQMKRDWGPKGGNNRRIKPRTTWAKKITPKGA